MRSRPSGQGTPVTFQVNGHEIRLLEDGSEYSAWSLRNSSPDDVGIILQRFEAELREADSAEAGKIIDVLFRKNKQGILWSSLLMVAAERPEIYADRLWDLTSNEKMLLSRSVGPDAIAAVAAFYSRRSVEERRAFELAAFQFGADDAFHKMGKDSWLAGLFQAIGVDQLVSEEARAYLGTEEGSKPVTTQRWAPKVTVSPVTQRHVLTESGVNFDDPPNDELQTKSEQVKKQAGLVHGGDTRIGDPGAALQQLQELHSAILEAESRGAHDDVIKNAEDTAGDLSVAILHAISREKLSLAGSDLRLLHDLCLSLSHSTREQYGRASRASVVPALFELCQHPEVQAGAVARIRELASDTDLHVGVLLAANLATLYEKAPETMWAIAEDIVARETREEVLQAFVAAFLGQMVSLDAARVEAMLLSIAARFPFEPQSTNSKGRRNLDESMAQLFGALYVWHDREASRHKVFRWTTDPLTYKELLRSCLYATRGATCSGYDDTDPDSAGPRIRVQALIHAVVDATVGRIEAYYREDYAEQTAKKTQLPLSQVEVIAQNQK